MHATWYEGKITCLVIKAPYLFMYGGKSADNKNLNDMYVLNIENY